jgi:uncharacterized membrane protein
MADDDKTLAEIRETLERTAGQAPEAQAAAIRETLMVQPTQAAADTLWKTVVIGVLLLIALLGIGAIVLAAKDKSTEAVLPVLTGLVGGLFGLFAHPSDATK